MRNKHYLSVAMLASALWPATASASDMTGVGTLMMMIYIVAPVTIVHLVLTLVLAILRIYRKRAVALWHAWAASVVPLLGMAVAVLELGGPRHLQSLFFVVMILLFALALAWLPMIIHAFQVPAYAPGHQQTPGAHWR